MRPESVAFIFFGASSSVESLKIKFLSFAKISFWCEAFWIWKECAKMRSVRGVQTQSQAKVTLVSFGMIELKMELHNLDLRSAVCY